MTNYIKVYSGNFIEIQRVFNELQKSNICAIIKDESESDRLAGFGSSIQGLQEIHVHRDEIEKTNEIAKNLILDLKAN